HGRRCGGATTIRSTSDPVSPVHPPGARSCPAVPCRLVRRGADGEFPIPALPFLGPVAGAAMMPVEIELLVSAQRNRRVVRRRVLDGLLGRGDSDRVIEPTYFPDPLRRNEYLVTQPPVARVHDQVPNGP